MKKGTKLFFFLLIATCLTIARTPPSLCFPFSEGVHITIIDQSSEDRPQFLDDPTELSIPDIAVADLPDHILGTVAQTQGEYMQKVDALFWEQYIITGPDGVGTTSMDINLVLDGSLTVNKTDQVNTLSALVEVGASIYLPDEQVLATQTADAGLILEDGSIHYKTFGVFGEHDENLGNSNATYTRDFDNEAITLSFDGVPVRVPLTVEIALESIAIGSGSTSDFYHTLTYDDSGAGPIVVAGGDPAYSIEPYKAAQVPEPATLFLLVIGLGSLVVLPKKLCVFKAKKYEVSYLTQNRSDHRENSSWN
ncbi:MAG TPA: PEP-CTERM sorting domain-containing protein [Archaeoglobus sp.]|nr:PEP-CTERM sorting domain-containing protein [Archaeoglobus sp.]